MLAGGLATPAPRRMIRDSLPALSPSGSVRGRKSVAAAAQLLKFRDAIPIAARPLIEEAGESFEAGGCSRARSQVTLCGRQIKFEQGTRWLGLKHLLRECSSGLRVLRYHPIAETGPGEICTKGFE